MLSTAGAETPYTVINLGTLGGDGSSAWDINNERQIVGHSQTASSQYGHAFVWENNMIQGLGSLGGEASEAYAINQLGQVVGRSDYNDDPTVYHAFLWENGVMSDLGTLGGDWSVAEDINNLGQVVGQSGNRGFIWQDGTMTQLVGGTSSHAIGINNLGQVVGQARSGSTHAALWENGELTYIDTSFPFSSARDINDSMQIVGTLLTPTGETHAFFWENEVMTDMGVLPGYDVSHAYAINNIGHVVGHVTLYSGGPVAFIWKDGVMTNLNDLIALDSGWHLEMALGINDYGEIVGFGEYNGDPRAFLLIPEPATLSLLLLGVGLVARRRKRI